MAPNQSKLSKLWEELKRRKVVKVVILYSTTAFILLQILSLIVEPLKLPAWVMPFFIVLMIVGFPIAIIFSWIFDVTPEGIEITVASHKKRKQESINSSSKKSIVTNTIIGILLIIVAIFAYPKIFTDNSNIETNSQLEKSIAVLPFINDSSDEDNTYLINGMMEEILNKLEKIEDLKVVSRTSVEKYRDKGKKSIREIADELRVKYILEGSGQKVGDRIKLTLQLIEAETDNHLWSKPFKKEVSEANIFELQEEVALAVATDLKAIITPEEIIRVVKNPTENMNAYNLYLLGRDNLERITGDEAWINRVYKAKKQFEEAIELDSTFADAYSWLASVYINNLAWRGNFYTSDKYLDSGFVMIEKTLHYNKTDHFALVNKRTYFIRKGMHDEAKKIESMLSKKQIKNSSYYLEQTTFSYSLGDPYNQIKFFYKYMELKPKDELTPSYLFQNVSVSLAQMGYPEIAKIYLEKSTQYNSSSRVNNNTVGQFEFFKENYEAWYNYVSDRYESDTTRIGSLRDMMAAKVLLRDFQKAYEIVQKLEAKVKYRGDSIRPDLMVGYVHLKIGLKPEANRIFKLAIKRLEDEIELKNINAQFFGSHFDLACIYAVIGNKEKAFEYLTMVRNSALSTAVRVKLLKVHPMLDNIRDAQEFKDILKDIESKYQKNHERIGELLKEQGLL